MQTEAQIREQLAQQEYSPYETQRPDDNRQTWADILRMVGPAWGTAAGGIMGGMAIPGLGAIPGMAIGGAIGGLAGNLAAAPFEHGAKEGEAGYMKSLSEEQRMRMMKQKGLINELAKIRARQESMSRLREQQTRAAAMLS